MKRQICEIVELKISPLEVLLNIMTIYRGIETARRIVK